MEQRHTFAPHAKVDSQHALRITERLLTALSRRGVHANQRRGASPTMEEADDLDFLRRLREAGL